MCGIVGVKLNETPSVGHVEELLFYTAYSLDNMLVSVMLDKLIRSRVIILNCNIYFFKYLNICEGKCV